MILSIKIKEQTLYKLDRLLRQIIISTYLDYGKTDFSMNEIDRNSNNILRVAKKIHNDKDVIKDELETVDAQYRLIQPESGSVNGGRNEFEFEGE